MLLLPCFALLFCDPMRDAFVQHPWVLRIVLWRQKFKLLL